MRETATPISSDMRNARIDFSTMTAKVVTTDQTSPREGLHIGVISLGDDRARGAGVGDGMPVTLRVAVAG